MADRISSEERQNMLLRKQVKHMEEELKRRKLHFEELQNEKKRLDCLHSMMEGDTKDIAEHVERCIAAGEKELEEKAQRAQRQQGGAEENLEVLKLKHQQELQEMQEQVQELSTEVLGADFDKHEDLEVLEKQLVQEVSEIVSESDSLKKQLEIQRKEQEAAISNLKVEVRDKKKRRELEAWRRVDSDVDAEVANIVQKERAEHSKLRDKVNAILNRCIPVWKESFETRKQVDHLCLETDVMRKSNDVVNQKNLNYRKKEVEPLMKMCQSLKVELKQLSTASESFLAEEKLLRCNQTSNQQETEDPEQLRAEILGASRRRRRLEGVSQEAIIVLRQIMKGKSSTAHYESLLEILQRSAPSNEGSTPEQTSAGETPGL
ncbi:spindle assembly abnormal protein 6 homolog [Gymnodraco acuticeps]|uniref:Spindle assembly abnormal protein 6 homolog n=1 Tax=Gymnodraco acuticeps TaxID=8218 RepID=A0A6P8SW42_GYMAC|nr:spindle assembly abnormal protein 6 homolog [Gymnodraco acuticeps]